MVIVINLINLICGSNHQLFELQPTPSNHHSDTSGQQGDESRVYLARTTPGFHINKLCVKKYVNNVVVVSG